MVRLRQCLAGDSPTKYPNHLTNPSQGWGIRNRWLPPILIIPPHPAMLLAYLYQLVYTKKIQEPKKRSKIYENLRRNRGHGDCTPPSHCDPASRSSKEMPSFRASANSTPSSCYEQVTSEHVDMYICRTLLEAPRGKGTKASRVGA